MDTGSQRTFVSSRLAEQLELRPHSHEVIDISVFGDGNSSRKILPCAEVEITTHSSPVKLQALIVPSISEKLANYDRSELLRRYPHLKNIALAPQCSGGHDQYALDVLIGADACWQIIEDGVVRVDAPGPVAMASKLGYLISGPTSLPIRRGTVVNVEHVLATIAQAAPSVPEYFEVEKLGVLPTEPDVDATEDSFNFDRYVAEDITQAHDKHYMAALPVNEKIKDLPSYYNVCAKVTREMVRKVSLDKRLAYHKIILDQLDRGFIEYTTEKNTSDGHYLMHYGVEKPSSSTTPLRIVYRCNFKLGNSPSLNDCLHPGIPMLQDLGGIFMRTRLFDKVLSSDIEKAFLQVKLVPEHRKYTKFLWISDPYDADSPFAELQFTSVFFGASPSSFILNAVLYKHLKANDCEIARLITRDVYVDNLISSVPTRELATDYYHTANKILADGGFKLRSWTSNDPHIQKLAEQDDIAMPGNHINVLGMLWKRESDTMACKPLPPLGGNKPQCPKSALSETARLFDVPGFLLPVHVRAKRLLQDFQRSKMKGKTPLPPDKAQTWQEIHADLRLATSTISWPRQAIKGLLPDMPVELHLFADSSKVSLGAVAYLVGNHQSSIMWAKNSLVPVKETQPRIPRYELESCVMASNLFTYIMNNIGSCINIVKTTLWSDSQIVLCWLNSTKKLEAFVQRRVKKIKAKNFAEIRYCPTRQMPADLLTRGISTKQLKASELWWHGPEWLLTKEYPTCDVKPVLPSSVTVGVAGAHRQGLAAIPEEDENKLAPLFDVDAVCKIVDLGRHSTLRKLVRVTALAYVFARKLLMRVRRLNPEPDLTSATNTRSLQLSQDAWFRHVQGLHYPNEIAELRKETRRKTPLVRQLDMFLDERDILRKGSRMKNAPNLPEHTKYRVILPRNHYFTTLIIRQTHAMCLHDGVQHTLSSLRRNFWVSRDSVLVKRILKGCVTCNRINSRHFKSPPTPDLPRWRLDSTQPPFTTVGIDYTGEVWVKDKPTGERRKVYIVLYTCAVTRAVHLHYVEDQTAEQFLLSFTQFCARKSFPARVYSDNATTFVAANEILKDIMTDPSVRDFMAERHITWQYIPKRAPWFGAIYERLIGIMKRNLIKVIGKALLSAYELETVLVKIEANMNDRPLTRCTASDGDDERLIPITPAHLIYGRRITPFPPLDTDPNDEPYVTKITHESANQSLQRMSQLHEHYWNRFNHEYLLALMETHKLQKKADFHQTIKLGDVVLVHEDVKRPQWKMAIVSKLLPGPDGVVRAVEIKTANGVTNRPIVKLYPLELSLENYAVDQRQDQAATAAAAENLTRDRLSRAAKNTAIERNRQIAAYERGIPD